MSKPTYIYIECLTNGKWIEIIKTKIKEEATEKDIKNTIIYYNDLLYDSDKVEFKNNDNGVEAICIRGLNTQLGIFRVRAM